jgi:hypothetical protein
MRKSLIFIWTTSLALPAGHREPGNVDLNETARLISQKTI